MFKNIIKSESVKCDRVNFIIAYTAVLIGIIGFIIFINVKRYLESAIYLLLGLFCFFLIRTTSIKNNKIMFLFLIYMLLVLNLSYYYLTNFFITLIIFFIGILLVFWIRPEKEFSSIFLILSVSILLYCCDYQENDF